jgi:hypothetical protein
MRFWYDPYDSVPGMFCGVSGSSQESFSSSAKVQTVEEALQ